LGPYEILAALGAGGMGEVYKARDTRLSRTVAIKVLPPDAYSDPHARERLEREARAISALNHPHICTFYDIGHDQGVQFLVMEFVEGESLAARLMRGQLPVVEALRHAIELVSALDRAHRAGIVHRDIKPANVMITRSGIKLLDFGVAKLRPLAGVAVGPDTAAVTEAAALTREGEIVGTLQYMAPEQLEGREADARTDIFAFGATLYEMVTGVKAFAAASQAALIAAILNQSPPPISRIQPRSPRALDDIVQRCLAKDPDERWQTAADLAFALRRTTPDLSDNVAASETHRGEGRTYWARRLLVTAIIATALVTSAVLVWTRSSPSRTPQLPVRLLLSRQPVAAMTENGPLPGVGISRDGHQVVYVAETDGVRRLYVRQMQGKDAFVLAGTEGAIGPFFSPDGGRVGFFAAGQLKTVAIAGGAPTALAAVVNARGATWADDDTIIYSPGTDAGLWQVAASGGTPRQLTVPDPDKGERSFRWPAVLPGREAVVYTLATSQILSFDEARLVVRSLRTGEQRELVRGGSFPTFVAPDLLLYARAGALLAVRLDPARLQVTSSATTVLDDVMTYPVNGGAQYALASNGTLVYVPGGTFTREAALTWYDRTGNSSRLNVPPLPYNRVSLSRDAKQAALDIDGANASVWILDLSRPLPLSSALPMTRLTMEWSNNLPFWTPDATRVGFVSARRGVRTLFWQSVDGRTAPERLVEHHESDIFGASLSPDGKTLMFEERRLATGSDLWVASVAEDRKPTTFLQTSFNEQLPQFSPDGQWVAYVSDESGHDEIFVQRYPGPGRKWKVSVGGGFEPVWAANGRELFYLNGDAVMAAAVETASGFSAGEPRQLFRKRRAGSRGQSYAVAPDGRFLMIEDVRTPASEVPVTVVLNWLDDVKARLSSR
jgi:serine/threonine-protein kinase